MTTQPAEQYTEHGTSSVSHRTHYITPGSGERKYARFHMSQAVRVGDLLEVAGQSGADDVGNYDPVLSRQITQSLENVRQVLEHAGASWSDVFSVTSYHSVLSGQGPAISEEALNTITRFFRTALPDAPPLWTAVPVPALAHPGMHIEISVRAALSVR